MTNEFTAVFQKEADGFVAFVEELPGANTQGDTLEEARENLREAIQLILEANRDYTRGRLTGDYIRERVVVSNS